MSDNSGVEIRPEVAMYAAFARLNYEPWYALAEFVDNSLQSYLANGDALRAADGKASRLRVGIQITEDRIEIRDNAAGIARADFPRAFRPASPPPDTSGLSEFGLGMKAAACWFSQRWSVETAALGEAIQSKIVYDIPKITGEHIERLPVVETPCWDTEHFTHLTLEALNVHPKTSAIAKIRRHLASIYRKFLQDGSMELRFQGEKLEYESRQLLHAPRADDPQGEPIEWRKEIDLSLGEGRRISGWAGLLGKASITNAGFALFRRDRLIEGSHGDTYRPELIFRKSNSFTYQRLVGELDVEGFSVSHTKDGIQWHDLEDEVLQRLRVELDQAPLPLLWQAESYRARPTTRTTPGPTGTQRPDSEPVTGQRFLPLAETEPDPHTGPDDDSAITPERLQYETSLDLSYQGQRWQITTEVLADESAYDWLDILEQEPVAGTQTLQVRLNIAHPFLTRFVSLDGPEIAAFVRLGAALAVAEATARAAGLRQVGSLRRSLNQILRDTLSGPVELDKPKGTIS